MLIASYSPATLGDTLVVVTGADVMTQTVTKKGDIVRISDPTTDQTLGYNFLKASQLIPDLTGQGQVILGADQVSQLNQGLQQAGFVADLTADTESHFRVGYVKTATPHPNSDHLLVTETELGHGKTVQIVSGSPNMQAGIKVVVAEVGAMMPDGLIIWPGELRGVASNGMICSGRELGLKNAPQRPGALILPDDFQVGDAFDFEKGQTIFAS